MSIVSRINEGQDLEKMFVRTLSRLIDLYSDRSHFIHELMQNAEDVGAHDMRFELFEDRLEVYHDGRPFTEDNLRGICDVGLSDKIGNVEQIGQFGIGFKAVFCICDVVRLYSCVENWEGPESENLGSFAVEIQNFIHPVEIQEEDLPWPFTTKFVFPFAIGKEYQSFQSCLDLAEFLDFKLKDFDSSSLLFMKNLTSITYVSHLGKRRTAKSFSLARQRISDNCIELYDFKDDKAPRYLRFSRPIEGDSRNVDIAFCFEIDKDGNRRVVAPTNPYLFIYFPSTTLSHLNFIVQGPYNTTPNRSTLPEVDEFNDMLVRETALLFRESVLAIRDMGMLNLQFLSLLPLSPPAALYDEASSSYRQKWMYSPVYEECMNLLQNEALIPNQYGDGFSDLNHSIIIRNSKLQTIFDENTISELYAEGDIRIAVHSITLDENRDLYDVLRRFKIRVLEVSSLPKLLLSNKAFLARRNKDWLCDFYQMLSDYPTLLKNSGAIGNFTNTPIILTQKGGFASPSQKNIYEPSNIVDDRYEYVDQEVFNRSHDFFNILELGHPDLLDSFMLTLGDKYSGNAVIPFSENVEDWKKLLELLKYKDLSNEQKNKLKSLKILAIHAPGQTTKSYISGDYKATYQEGTNSYYNRNYYLLTYSPRVDVEALYRGVENVGIVDIEEYHRNGVFFDSLNNEYDIFKINTSFMKPMAKGWHYNELITSSSKVRSDLPFNIDFDIQLSYEIFKSIDSAPYSEYSKEKSAIIMDICKRNPELLFGVYYERMSDPIEHEGPCSLLIKARDFNWVYSSDGKPHQTEDMDRHDLDSSLYGKMPEDLDFYKALGFKENVEDSVTSMIDEFYDDADEEKQAIFVDKVLQKHFGMTKNELVKKIEIADEFEAQSDDVFDPESAEYDVFPVRAVNNLERLKQYDRKLYENASYVAYEDRVIKHRVSIVPAENKEYVQSMYAYGNTGFYACQMCGKPSRYITSGQIDNSPKKELAPMHLCLCPTCYRHYLSLRHKGNGALIEQFLDRLVATESLEDNVSIKLADDVDVTFTAMHLNEIKELLQCASEDDSLDEDSEVLAESDAVDSKTDISDSLQNSSDRGFVSDEHTKDGADIVRRIEELNSRFRLVMEEVGLYKGESAILPTDISSCDEECTEQDSPVSVSICKSAEEADVNEVEPLESASECEVQSVEEDIESMPSISPELVSSIYNKLLSNNRRIMKEMDQLRRDEFESSEFASVIECEAPSAKEDVVVVEPLSREEAMLNYREQVMARRQQRNSGMESDVQPDVFSPDVEVYENQTESYVSRTEQEEKTRLYVDGLHEEHDKASSDNLDENTVIEVEEPVEPLSREVSCRRYIDRLHARHTESQSCNTDDVAEPKFDADHLDENVPSVDLPDAETKDHEEESGKYLERLHSKYDRPHSQESVESDGIESEKTVEQLSREEAYQRYIDKLHAEKAAEVVVETTHVQVPIHDCSATEDKSASDAIDVVFKEFQAIRMQIDECINYSSKSKKFVFGFLKRPDRCEKLKVRRVEDATDDDYLDFSKYSMSGSPFERKYIQNLFMEIYSRDNRIPTRLEFFLEGLRRKEYYQISDYQELKSLVSPVSDISAIDVRRSYIMFLENLAMNKDYKIPVLLSFLGYDGQKNQYELSADSSEMDLYRTCKRFYDTPWSRLDLKLPRNKSVEEAEVSDFVTWARTNPARYISDNPKSQMYFDGIMHFKPSMFRYLDDSGFVNDYIDALEYRYARFIVDRQRIING